MTLTSVGRLGALCVAVALVIGPSAQAQMRGSSSSQHESGVTACNGRGETRFDRCFCDPGWTGAQCEAREAPPDCGDHGKAANMRCVCEAGWAGKSCEVACAHGKPEHGSCACAAGWSGAACDMGAPAP